MRNFGLVVRALTMLIFLAVVPTQSARFCYLISITFLCIVAGCRERGRVLEKRLAADAKYLDECSTQRAIFIYAQHSLLVIADGLFLLAAFFFVTSRPQ